MNPCGDGRQVLASCLEELSESVFRRYALLFQWEPGAFHTGVNEWLSFGTALKPARAMSHPSQASFLGRKTPLVGGGTIPAPMAHHRSLVASIHDGPGIGPFVRS